MPDLFGAASGVSQAQTDQDQHQIVQSTLQDQSISREKTGLEITAMKQTMQKQQAMLDAVKTMNFGGANNPQGQAMGLADQSFQLGKAAMGAGLFQEANEYLATGAKLADNASKLEDRRIGQEEKLWTDVKQMTQNIKSPQEWEQAKMLIQQMHPDALQHQNALAILKAPYSPQLIQSLRDASESGLQRSERQRADAGTYKETVEAKLDQDRMELTKQQTSLAAERTAKLKKEGSQGSKKEQEQAAMQDDVMNDLQDLIGQVKSDPHVVGLRGKGQRLLETAKGVTGLGDQATPANTFESSLDTTLIKLHKALAGSSSRYNQHYIDDAANALKAGTTGEIAINKLQKVFDMVKAERDRSPVPGADGDSKEVLPGVTMSAIDAELAKRSGK